MVAGGFSAIYVYLLSNLNWCYKLILYTGSASSCIKPVLWTAPSETAYLDKPGLLVFIFLVHIQLDQVHLQLQRLYAHQDGAAVRGP